MIMREKDCPRKISNKFVNGMAKKRFKKKLNVRNAMPIFPGMKF